MLGGGAVTSARLSGFYCQIAAPVALSAAAYRRRFADDVEENHRELARPEFRLPAPALERLLASQRRFLAEHGALLEQRAGERRIVEAHGDLRPEHVYLLPRPVIMDCLVPGVQPGAEDARSGRRARLPRRGMRAPRRRGHRRRRAAGYFEATGDAAPAALQNFYRVFRACLRAKIAMWHTEDDGVHDWDKWRERAARYLELAARYA